MAGPATATTPLTQVTAAAVPLLEIANLRISFGSAAGCGRGGQGGELRMGRERVAVVR